MPLWTVYHAPGAYTADDKQAFAEAVVSLYPILPAFYTVLRERVKAVPNQENIQAHWTEDWMARTSTLLFPVVNGKEPKQ